MDDGQLTVRRRHFLTILARYARAKMEVERLSLDQLAETIGASGKNWVFRVLAHDEDPEATGGHIEAPLMRLIDWVGFGEQLLNAQSAYKNTEDTHWGDIRIAIMRCADIPKPLRWQLWALVQSWQSVVAYYENKMGKQGKSE